MKKAQDRPKEALIRDLQVSQELLHETEGSVEELQRAKTEAKDAQIYAENIIETMREPLLILDADLKILSSNRSFYATFKVTSGDTVGSYIYDLGNRQWNIPRLRFLLEEILPKNSQFDDFEVEHDFPDIGHKIMMLNARQIRQAESGREMILLAIEDVTQLRKLEREKRNIFSMFAHDMKNPLVTSEGFLARVIKGKAGEQLTKKQLDYLNTATSELAKVSELVSAFLDFSKYEARENSPVLAPVDICAVIRKIITAERVEAEKKSITLSFESQDGVSPTVRADEIMISRVIRNLLCNSIKYCESGSAVTVSVTESDDEILLSIQDTGAGISHEHLPYIFDAFYRGAADSKGSGLGLAIAKTIIELHGGRIGAQSVPLTGSTFWFTLPTPDKLELYKV